MLLEASQPKVKSKSASSSDLLLWYRLTTRVEVQTEGLTDWASMQRRQRGEAILAASQVGVGSFFSTSMALSFVWVCV